MSSDNLILLTDSYKISHWKQYPPGTTGVYSYFESRGGLFPEVTFFGLQYFVQKYLSKPVQEWDIVEARSLLKDHFFGQDMFNLAGWRHIIDDHRGYLPVRICAVPEGMTVPVRNVMMTVENTCPQCFWVTNYIESLLVETWYPCTVATQSRAIKKNIREWLLKTGGSLEGLDFKLHDFGFRGVSSPESAGIGGCAHLVQFKGTDTLQALRVARDYYGEPRAGFSIPAAEHSTITSWGRNREADAYDNMLRQYPGPVAVVSDSYNIYHACEEIWGNLLADTVRTRKGTLVIRPDSGDPPEVVCKVLDILASRFGTTTVHGTSGGYYKLLPPYLRVIQGDGVDLGMINRILGQMEQRGWCADNIAFGMGGALLQKLNRDTQRFAFKCSAQCANGLWTEVSKDPVTDPGKKSKAGRLKLQYDLDGTLWTAPASFPGNDLLEEVYVDGWTKRWHPLSAIREKAAI